MLQGGDPVEFRKINEAYKGLISHITKLEIIEEESKLSNESVIIEVSVIYHCNQISIKPKFYHYFQKYNDEFVFCYLIQISKQALPTWVDKLTKCYGKPKTANVANVIFQVIKLSMTIISKV